MSDWVIPLVALVPAILTALSGLLQPALKSRSDSRAAQAAADRERFVSRYDDAVALLCDSYARMSEVDRGDSFWRFLSAAHRLQILCPDAELQTQFARIADLFQRQRCTTCITDKYFSAALLILSRASAQTGPAEPASPEAPR